MEGCRRPHRGSFAPPKKNPKFFRDYIKKKGFTFQGKLLKWATKLVRMSSSSNQNPRRKRFAGPPRTLFSWLLIWWIGHSDSFCGSFWSNFVVFNAQGFTFPGKLLKWATKLVRMSSSLNQNPRRKRFAGPPQTLFSWLLIWWIGHSDSFCGSFWSDFCRLQC